MLSSSLFVALDANVSGSKCFGCISVKVIGGDVEEESEIVIEVRLASLVFR